MLSGIARSLLVVELRRTTLPFIRSLIPLGLIVVLSISRGKALPGLILMAGGVAVALGMMVVPGQLIRDRRDGVDRYLASLPVSGAQLAGVRCLAIGLYVGVTVLAIWLVLELFPSSLPDTLSMVRVFSIVPGAWLIATALGIIVLGLLTRYSARQVIWGPVVGFLLLEVVHDNFGKQLGLLTALKMLKTSMLKTWGPTALLLFLGGTVMLGLIVGAILAFRLAASSLQPRRGLPTSRARGLLTARRSVGADSSPPAVIL